MATFAIPRAFANLEQILAEQNYWLAYWQDVNEGINYRRFFAISDLVGMRVEDPIVFEAMHEQIFRLIGKGAISGVSNRPYRRIARSRGLP